MNFKILRKFLQMAKYTFYGICLQMLLVGILLASSSEAQRQSLDKIFVSIDIDNLTLENALQLLSNETEFNFSYNDERINENEVVNASVKNKSMTILLKRMSKDYNLKFKRINENIYVSNKGNLDVDVEEEFAAIYQEREITGKVTSAEDNAGLPGVNVLVQGTSTGTITDVQGNYRIEVPDGAILEFSSVGYIKETIEVGTRTVIDLILNPDVTQLSEIVVIGYGTRNKKDLTGALSVMNEEEIKKSNAMAPELAMQGRMPGVLVTTPSGNPQDRPSVQIRGVGTFNVAEPLYVIDGIPVTEFGQGWEGAGTGDRAARVRDLRGPVNVLTLINPADIESMTVLKDASAAAIYGVRAANGVVIITTKQGKEGKAKVDVDIRGGVKNNPKTFDLLDVSRYTSLYQEAYANNPDQLSTMPLQLNPSDTVTRGIYDQYLGGKPTIDWQNPMLNQNATIFDATAKVYGGTEAVNYYVSGGYSRNEGPFINNFMDRYSIATNVNAKAGKYFEVGAVLRGAYVESRNQSPELTDAVSAPPWQPIRFEDDYYANENPEGEKWGYATVVDTTLTPNTQHPNWGDPDPSDPRDVPIYNQDFSLKYGPETEGNHFARSDIENRTYDFIRTLGTAYLAFKPMKGLTLKGTYSIDWYHQIEKTWRGIDTELYSGQPRNVWDAGDKTGTTKGSYGEFQSRNYNLTGEFLINYNNSFGDHNIDLTLNYMDQQYGFNSLSGTGNQQFIDDPDRRSIPETDPFWNSTFTDRDRYALQGYMGRVSYNFASKYYADVTVRRDGSSRFAPDYRWGTFPSAALAWRISAENFMANIKLINDLKLRAGWGQLGNQETRPFAYLSTVGMQPNYSYGSGNGNDAGNVGTGIRLPDFPTEDLSWETTTTMNLGFDAVLLKNRMDLTFEWYDRTTEDILQQAGLPPTVGNEVNPILNIATVRNRGIELQLGWSDNIGEVNYFINTNFTTVNNEVLDVWRDQPFTTRVAIDGDINTGSDLRIEKGLPMFAHWGWKVDGIFQDQEEVDRYLEEITDRTIDQTKLAPGDFYFQDLHGAPTEEELFYSTTPDSIMDDNDRTYLGSIIPGHYYGVSLGAEWKGIDISFFFQGIGDVVKENVEMRKGVSMSSQGINQWSAVENRWTPSNKNTWNPDDRLGSLPRAMRGDPSGNNRLSDRFVEPAGFFAMRNVTLGYSLPESIINNTNVVNRFRIYISGENLFKVTNWSGLDPENDNIPIPRIWTLGLNATF